MLVKFTGVHGGLARVTGRVDQELGLDGAQQRDQCIAVIVIDVGAARLEKFHATLVEETLVRRPEIAAAPQQDDHS